MSNTIICYNNTRFCRVQSEEMARSYGTVCLYIQQEILVCVLHVSPTPILFVVGETLDRQSIRFGLLKEV
jgi:hypothetical protein